MASSTDVFRTNGRLSRTPDPFRAAVLARCQPRTFAAGATVFSVGDPPTGLYGIMSGLIGVEIAPAERPPHLGFFGAPGAWIGFRAVVTRRERMVSLVARRKSQLMFLPTPAVDEIVRDDPACWRHFAIIALGEVRMLTTLCDDLTRRSHAERVIAVLLHFCNARFPETRGHERLDIDIGHEDLAQAANVGRTAAGAVLRDLEEAGHVALSYRRIVILSLPALRSRLTDGDVDRGGGRIEMADTGRSVWPVRAKL